MVVAVVVALASPLGLEAEAATAWSGTIDMVEPPPAVIATTGAPMVVGLGGGTTTDDKAGKEFCTGIAVGRAGCCCCC